MPIYEYQCQNCEHKMEAIQKISDKPLKDCPECEQDTLRKLVSAAAFKITGTGWYETDFKHNNSKAKVDKKSAEANSEKSNNSGKKSESKAEKPKKKEPATES